MIARKILLAAAAVALMSTPAWALPSQAPSSQGATNGPSATAGHHTQGWQGDQGVSGPTGPTGPTGASGPTGPMGPTGATGPVHGRGHGYGHGPEHGNGRGHGHEHRRGRPHKCLPHGVAYVAAGTLVSQTLSQNADGTYSGAVVVEVKRTNHHAAGDRGKTVTYELKNVHIIFAFPHMHKSGGVGLSDLAKGDRVHLIGRITVLARKCSQNGFIPATMIRLFVVHPQTNGS